MSSLPALQAALLHTLWQGLLLVLVVSLVLRLLPARLPNARYAVATIALAVFLVAFFATWTLSGESSHADQTIETPALAMTTAPANPASPVPGTPIPQQGRLVPQTLGRPVDFTKFLLPAWFLGTAFMLVRLCFILNATRALTKFALEPVEPGLLESFGTLRRVLRAPARATLRISARIATPLAFGFLQPVVLLPATWATGLPPEHLRAILAHELAHLRRHDYLINLIQLLAETAFYFNPALWWINRQIRIEREACCDQLAARHSGGPLDYADALSALARLGHGPTAPQLALAMQGEESVPGPFLDRVRRLLFPAQRPPLRLPWYSLAATLALTLVLLFATYSTTQAATNAVVSYLRMNNDARIDYLQRLDNRPMFTPPPAMDAVTLSGRIVKPDGSPFEASERSLEIIWGAQGRYGCQSTLLDEDGRISAKTVREAFYILHISPGFEPVIAGPFQPDENDAVDDIVIHLVPAVPARILLRDPAGRPVPNASVGVQYKFLDTISCGGIRERISDAEGAILLEQPNPLVPVNLEVHASGFQTTRFDALLAPAGQETVLEVAADDPVEIMLRNADNQEPLENANFYLVKTGGQAFGGEQACVTEALGKGRYLLKELDRGLINTVAVRVADLGGQVFQLDPNLDDRPVVVDISENYVHGTVQGDLEILKTYEGTYELATLYLAKGLDSLPLMLHGMSEKTPVTLSDGVGHFEMNGLFPGQVLITAAGKLLQIEVNGRVEDYVIQLDPEARAGATAPPSAPAVERPVELHIALETSPGIPRPKGYVTVYVRDIGVQTLSGGMSVPIADGAGTVQIPAGEEMVVALDGLAGYGFDRFGMGRVQSTTSTRLAPGKKNVTFTQRIVSTGAVEGSVVTADGVPVQNALVRVFPAESAQGFAGSLDGRPTDYAGHFNLRDLPLDARYILKMRYRNQDFEQTVGLSSAAPVANVTFTVPALPPQRTITVRAMQPNGSLVRSFTASVRLDSNPNQSMGAGTESSVAVINNVDSDAAGQVTVLPNWDYQPATASLAAGATEITVVVQPGHRARGRVLFADTQLPAAGASVDIRLDHMLGLHATTDRDGYFTFSNLPDGPVKVTGCSAFQGDYEYDLQGAPQPLAVGGDTTIYLKRWGGAAEPPDALVAR